MKKFKFTCRRYNSIYQINIYKDYTNTIEIFKNGIAEDFSKSLIHEINNKISWIKFKAFIKCTKFNKECLLDMLSLITEINWSIIE